MRPLLLAYALLCASDAVRPLSEHYAEGACRDFARARVRMREAAVSNCKEALVRGRCGPFDFLGVYSPGFLQRDFCAPDGGLIAAVVRDGPFEEWFGEHLTCEPEREEGYCPKDHPPDAGATNPLSAFCAPGPCRAFPREVGRFRDRPADAGCFSIGTCDERGWSARCGPGHLVHSSDGFVSREYFFDRDGALTAVLYVDDTAQYFVFGARPQCQPETVRLLQSSAHR